MKDGQQGKSEEFLNIFFSMIRAGIVLTTGSLLRETLIQREDRREKYICKFGIKIKSV